MYLLINLLIALLLLKKVVKEEERCAMTYVIFIGGSMLWTPIGGYFFYKLVTYKY